MDLHTEQTTPTRDLAIQKKAMSWAIAGIVTVLLTFSAAIYDGYGTFGLSWWAAPSLFGAGIVGGLVMFGVSSYHFGRC